MYNYLLCLCGKNNLDESLKRYFKVTNVSYHKVTTFFLRKIQI